MAMQISNWQAQQILNLALRGTAWTPPATVYLALYTSDPTAADTGIEVSGGGYARRPVSFAAAALENGMMTIKSSAQVDFADATADWGLVTHVGIRTASAGGNLMFFKAINARTILAGDKPKFPSGSTLVRFAQ
ncbi:phage tail fiber protein [Paenibacillus sp. BAC0078]